MREELLPHDPEAEAIALGAAMLTPTHLERVTAELTAQHFHAPLHRAVYDALVELSREDRQVTLNSVCEYIGQALPNLGGAAAVSALLDGLPRMTDIERWVRPLKDKAMLRGLIRVGREIETGAMREDAEGVVVLDRAQSALLDVSRIGSSDGFVDNTEAVPRAIRELERMANSPNGIFGIESGLADLDKVTGGFRAGDLVLVGAETSGGKSALAMQIGEHAAKQGKKVAFFSLEMSDIALFMRRICAEARVSSELLRLKSGPELEDAWSKILTAANKIMARSLWIDPTSWQTVGQLLTRARRKQVQDGLDMVIVDYIQLVHGIAGKRYDTRAVEVGEVAYGLLAMAKDLGVPVIAPVQFSRAASTRPDKRPQLSDLKESSSLEQASEVVILVWHEETRDTFADMTNAELIVAKNRRGRKGTANVRFNRFLSKFENAADEITNTNWKA